MMTFKTYAEMDLKNTQICSCAGLGQIAWSHNVNYIDKGVGGVGGDGVGVGVRTSSYENV